MTKTYHKEIIVPLQDIDAAGVLFFANLFRYAHETYECFMTAIDFPLSRYISEGRVLIPVVHTEADYKKPIIHGSKLRVELRIEKLGEHSFTLSYQCIGEENVLYARVRTIHVLVDAASHRPIELPDNFVKALQEYQ